MVELEIRKDGNLFYVPLPDATKVIAGSPETLKEFFASQQGLQKFKLTGPQEDTDASADKEAAGSDSHQ